ncbi:MAG: leucine-rich repeat domain-containing protein [Clostridia bacterium]|nr:leucine-rich repeat domain-containing protein [Clostridia bacterium]
MKKLISVILTLVMLLSVVPMSAVSVGAELTSGTTGDCIWSLNGTVLTISGNGKMKDYGDYFGRERYEDIPWGTDITKVVINEGVTEIGTYSFHNCDSIVSVTIPTSIKRIGSMAFYNCKNIENVNISDISSWCDIEFDASDVDEIFGYSNPLYYAKDFRLNGSVITHLQLSDGIEYLNDYAFYGCKCITSITIPNSIKKIGYAAFQYCKNLKNAYITDISTWCALNPDNPDGAALRVENLYLNNQLIKDLIITDNITKLGYYAFYDLKSIESVTLPVGELNIDNEVFRGCDNLKSVYYRGTKQERNNLVINKSSKLDKSVWYYESCIGEAEHTYDDSCDTDCNVCDKVLSDTAIYQPKKTELSTTEYTYNGKTKKPSVSVYDSKDKKLKYGKDYTYSRPKNSKKVGQYTIKVNYKGKYNGTKNLNYEINPKGTKVSSSSAAKKSLKVKIKKQSSQTSGYQIQYSTSSKFKSSKTKTTKSTSYTIKSLESKKNYYVRVRTYKTVDGKKYYSDWSTAVKKKTK